MRKFSNILLKDIISNNHSKVFNEFSDYLDKDKISKICNAFKNRSVDNDISIFFIKVPLKKINTQYTPLFYRILGKNQV